MSPIGGMAAGPSFSGRVFPALGQRSQRTEGRYLVLERTDEDQTLEKLSPFLIDKAIRNCCGDVNSVKRIKDGKILIHTKTDKQGKQLEKLKSLAQSINRSPEIGDEEILEELRAQKVTKLERILRKTNGIPIKTSTFILTLETTVPPQEIKVGFLSVKTRPYYPRPMRCFQCFAFGHIGENCNRDKLCANCGDKEHGEQCDKNTKCVNCGEPHSALNRRCRIFNKEVEIVKLKVDRDITFFEARQLVELRETPKTRYTDAVNQNNRQCNCKCTCSVTIPETSSNAEASKPATPSHSYAFKKPCAQRTMQQKFTVSQRTIGNAAAAAEPQAEL
ncbi:uncharacterized protein LOC131434311 [Malaya genurostris]|uniref:uncharacterized protein LOC131434311 n=1 Tax=Malaya genurostris TaxID=325434 RepID=UPI0026F3F1D6|nr:uncharacterized protein LOC131434311 [Malaya genurostris]